MCVTTPGSTPTAARSHVYSADTLRSFDTDASQIIGRNLRKLFFSWKLWSPRYKYRSHPADRDNKRDVDDQKNVNQKKTAVSGLEFGVEFGSRVDYVIDHAKENKLDVVVLTETWLSNVETNNATVVNYCMKQGYTLHHRPRSDGRRGGDVDVLVSNKIKLTTRQVSVDPKVASFQHMELVITVSSITIRLIIIYRMPRSKGAVNTDGEQLSFCDEFSNYIEKLSCASGVILLAEYISNFAVSHFISDHRALHASVRCIRPHPVRKRLRVRALRRIDGERLDSDLASFTVDNECVDVNTVVARYDEFLSSLLNKHAPLKEIDVVERPLNDWMTDNILALKKIRRQREKIWRQSPITINYDLYYESCEAVKNAIKDSKTVTIQNKINDCKGDQKNFFKIIDSLLGRKKQQVLPEYTCSFSLATMINTFFVEKIDSIRAEFPLLEPTLQPYSFTDIDSIMSNCDIIFDHFEQLTRDDLMKIISVMNKTTCVSDPFPTKLLMSHLPAIVDINLGIVNLCFESAVFLLSCKSSVIIPLIKKPGLDSEVLKNYRPVANLPFLSKVIEKAIAIQIHKHLSTTGIIDDFQSAYKAGHSCETALLRVFNDIASTIGKGNGNLLVLLDLSAAFDTIDLGCPHGRRF